MTSSGTPLLLSAAPKCRLTAPCTEPPERSSKWRKRLLDSSGPMMSLNCSIPLPPTVVKSMSRLLDLWICSLCNSAPHSLHITSEKLRLLHAAAVAYGRLLAARSVLLCCAYRDIRTHVQTGLGCESQQQLGRDSRRTRLSFCNQCPLLIDDIIVRSQVFTCDQRVGMSHSAFGLF